MTVILLLLWTLLLYGMHRLVHVVPWLAAFHIDHHYVVARGITKWHWNNLFLFNDTWRSTVDLWITEVVPTIVFCAVFGNWVPAVLYYLWAAFLQETLEHDRHFDVPILTSGRWHMVHHTYWYTNFGVFIPLWDIIFRTYAPTPHET